jgi:hypothetical protein
LLREGYLEEFIRFWSEQQPVERIWMSLYTPQKNEISEERLTPEDRNLAVDTLLKLRPVFPKLDMPPNVIKAYQDPPKNPDTCIFAKATTCVSADFEKIITPCQFGGDPDCENCGCMASAGLSVVGKHPLKLGLTAGHVYNVSRQIGHVVKTLREPRTSASQ